MDCLGTIALTWKKHDGNSEQPFLLEDLRNHSPEELEELRQLLDLRAPLRADPRRRGFFEVDGHSRVFYILKYPSGSKILLIAVWDRVQTPQHANTAHVGDCEKIEIGELILVCREP